MQLNLDALGHSVTAAVDVPGDLAFTYLSDPMNVGKWTFGTWVTETSDVEGLYCGTSLFSGKRNWFRLGSDRRLMLIDYHVGDRTRQLPRISVRVIPAEHFGGAPHCCLVTLHAWRHAEMDDSRWRQLVASHEAEIFLIKALLEREVPVAQERISQIVPEQSGGA